MAPSERLQRIMAGKSQWQDLEAAVHCVPEVKIQRVTNEPLFSAHSLPLVQFKIPVQGMVSFTWISLPTSN